MATSERDRLPIVIYIAGIGRSGSTLLADLMNSVGGMATVGELPRIWDRGWAENWACSDGTPFREHRTWKSVLEIVGGGSGSAVFEALRDRADRVRKRRHLLNLSPRHTAPIYLDYVRDFSRVYQAISRVIGVPIIVDAGKVPYHAILMARSEAVDFRVVHLVRDPCAVAYSRSQPKSLSTSVGAKRTMGTSRPEYTAARWAYLNLRLATWGGSLSHQKYVRMHYERLVADPVGEMELLLNSLDLGLSIPPTLESGEFDRRPSLAFSGNPDRMRPGTIRIQEDTRWQERLPADAQRRVRLLTGFASRYVS